MKRKPFKTGRTRGNHVGALVHADVCGPMQRASLSGAYYFLLIKDDFSGWITVDFLKTKGEVADLIQRYATRMKIETGRTVETLRTDNGGEFLSTSLKSWLLKPGSRHETSTPYKPAQNGVAERVNRTVMEASRSLIHGKDLPEKLWAEAVAYSVYTLNRVLSSSSVTGVTPFEAWHKKRPDVSHHRIFGAKTYVHVPDKTRRKLGFDITRDRPNRKLFLSQTDYTRQIIRGFNMEGCDPKSTPAEVNARLESSMSPSDPDAIERVRSTPYREAIGSLMYFMTMTRPDISFAVGQAARRCCLLHFIH